MSFELTMRAVYMPDVPPDGQPEGTATLDITSTFTITNDAHAELLLEALKEAHTQRARGAMMSPGGKPVRPGTPIYIPSDAEGFSLSFQQYWAVLKGLAEKFVIEQAAAHARSRLPDFAAAHKTKVDKGSTVGVGI